MALARTGEGLAGEYGEYAHIGWNTWRRLRDYKAGALVEEHGLRRAEPSRPTFCARYVGEERGALSGGSRKYRGRSSSHAE